jgi:hypothetical protein
MASLLLQQHHHNQAANATAAPAVSTASMLAVCDDGACRHPLDGTLDLHVKARFHTMFLLHCM